MSRARSTTRARTLGVAAVAALTLALGTPGAWAQEAPEPVKEIKQDRREIRRETRMIREDRRELREDRRQLRQDLAAGDTEAVEADRQAIREDRQELRQGLKARKGAVRDVHQDRARLERAREARVDQGHGAFDALSPGGQKIAQALATSQEPSGGQPRLTRGEIAAKKLDGQGWGGVVKDLKAQGLVEEKNLGQVVRNSPRPVERKPTVITTGSGRTYTAGGPPRVAAAGAGSGKKSGTDGGAKDGGVSARSGASDGASHGRGGLGHGKH